MEEMERFDPTGLERIELAIATLTSTVMGFAGKPPAPAEVVADWGGLRARARAEREANVDHLALARERAGPPATRQRVRLGTPPDVSIL